MYSSFRAALLLLAAGAFVGSARATTVPDDVLERLAARGETWDSIVSRNTNTNNYCSPGSYWQTLFGSYGWCIDCPAGSWCPGGNNAPVNKCPAGTYNDDSDSSSSRACKDCSAGYYSSSSGSTKCTRCPNGQTSNSGSSSCTAVNSHRPRAMKAKRAGAQCKLGFMSCPIMSGRGGMECLDIDNDLESCGGCVGYDGEGTGVDCTSIPGVNTVQCVGGQCIVQSCERGYRIGDMGTSCERTQGLLTQLKRSRRQVQVPSAL
ncbi:hypothetical protein CALCODRAFT_556336 [Calocera cornea HHB12733]|uniref:Tyrosine-protein kinase ephrin type A/B receptor-like domain-containing protein n=1 Tax=Calocera cornea HHB12733 TaxID=1353952 RepID=A0A165EW29_9BASI|nr:hypothetical protein CALCODRAFT_556336 [Calocera cornea HHB12733]